MKLVNKFLKPFGLKLFPLKDANISFLDIDDKIFWELYDKVKDYTMVSIPNLYALYSSVKYIVENNIEGDLVECGVWRGGCSMMMALTLGHYKNTNRIIYMYDTFEGMSEPTLNDKDVNNTTAKDYLDVSESDKNITWCIANIDDVKNNISKTNYPLENLKLIKGKVEDTLKIQIPLNNLALLRLDTDWYESTKMELEILYPKLNKQGILIIDDYGHWLGARKAVDEYFTYNKNTLLLNRVDYTCRLGLKN